jgi:putative methionine-R-sulfoxide reductase with GAF domain
VIQQEPQPGDEVLHRIMVVTDAALSQLDNEALFDELLGRTCALLSSDTAAIMLVDEDAQQLVTVAACGLEDEVRQGFRVDIGRGFTGRVAATRAPVIVEKVDADTVTSSVLLKAGVHALAGVPMMAGGELVGVLHVGTYGPRQFTEPDIALLQLVADRAALASQAGRHRAEREATLAIQRSLLPTRLPRVPGVDLAGRYVPGHHLGVGGDWYDVFTLPSGDLGVVVGDVSGHGLRAAVVMGRLRSALRSYALIEDDPATVLTFLDRKIQHFETGNLATVLYAKISPDRTKMLLSSAGHLAPVLATPGEPARLVSLPVDLPVGVGDSSARCTVAVDLPVGSTVVAYTDGLVERRGEIIDEGQQRLAARVRAEPAARACASIMAAMDVRDAEDDVAVLAIHTTET